MYKRASRAMIHATQIDRVQPTGGYIGIEKTAEDDFIPSADNMGLSECQAESRQLQLELTKAQAELAAGKASGDLSASQISGLGLKIQTLVQRKSLIKKRLHVLVSEDQYQRLREAVYQLCEEALRSRIFDYCMGKTEKP